MYYIKYTVILIAMVVNGLLVKKPQYDLKDAPNLFYQFQQKYNRHYDTEEDKARHYEDFVVNLQRINYLNSRAGPAIYDINMFTDHLVNDYKLLVEYMSTEEETAYPIP